MLQRSLWITVACAITVVGAPYAAPAKPPAAKEFELRSRTLIEGPAKTICFFNERIILGTGGGIAVFQNDSTLKNPSFIPVDGMPCDIAVKGNIAYIAASSGGLRVLDLSEVTRPQETWRFATPRATRCACAGRGLFLADSENKLFIFDIESPREPRIRETKDLPFPPVSLASDGDTLAVVYARKADIFRVLPSGAMEQFSEVNTSSDVQKGLMRNGILYLLTTKGEVLCFDFVRRNPPFPLEALRQKDVVDIAVSERSGILLMKSGFLVPFDVERATGPNPGASEAMFKVGKAFNIKSVQSIRQIDASQSAFLESNKPTAVFTSDKRFALISPFDGVRLYEREGAGARFLGLFATRGFAINLIAARGLLYVANAYDGIRIANVGTEGAVDWIGHIQTEEARDAALSGTNLVIADGEGGLKIADVTDPRNPKIIGRRSSPYYMSAVAVYGTRAYCAGGLGGVEIVDIADPRRPKLVWREHFSEVRGIWADSLYLYFADGFKGFRIYSLAAKKPASLSVLDTPGWNCDCLVIENAAYLADGGRGVIVADVSDRKNPRAIGSLSLGTIARKIRVLRKTLFAAADTRGIAAIDISDPRNPVIASWYQTVDDGRGVFADDDFVYLASGSGGVYIFKYHN